LNEIQTQSTAEYGISAGSELNDDIDFLVIDLNIYYQNIRNILTA
jgi:hypothetical protein